MTGSLAERFEEAVDRFSGDIAVDTGAATVTFAELDARANQFATWLGSVGIQRGDRVGLALWNRLEHLEALLGAFKAGAVPLNVNCRYTPAELEALLVDARARVVVHEEVLSLGISEASRGQDWLTLAIGADYATALDACPARRPEVPHSGDDEYLIYTGGSSGVPKGVRWRQADIFAAAMAGSVERRPGSRMLPASPLTHGTAQWTTLSTLLSGGTVVLGPPHGLDAAALWDRVAQCRVTRLVIVGDAFARPLLDALDAEPHRWDLSSLVAITSGGARWSTATRRGLLEHLPQAAMVNSFGASETGGQGSQVSFAGQIEDPAVGLLQFTPDATTTVLDDQRRPVAPGSGITGVLARTGAVPLGYHDDPERNALVFPVIDGVRHAMPGDLATVESDGSIVVLGRDRNVINTGGEKVFAEEVEARLIAHDAVTEAVVAGVPHSRWGECINALVVPAGPQPVTPEELVEHCAETLARFKVPRVITITDTIRRLPNGKLDRVWAADTMARLSLQRKAH